MELRNRSRIFITITNCLFIVSQGRFVVMNNNDNCCLSDLIFLKEPKILVVLFLFSFLNIFQVKTDILLQLNLYKQLHVESCLACVQCVNNYLDL